MCRYSDKNYKSHLVCLDCRLNFKAHQSRDCPECGKEMVFVGRDFKAPKRSNKRQWRKVARLLEAGYRFDSCGCSGPGHRPRTLAEVPLFILRGLHKKFLWGADKNKRLQLRAVEGIDIEYKSGRQRINVDGRRL